MFTIVGEVSKTPSPSTRIVTDVFGGVQGNLYKGYTLAGCCSQTTGQRPYPPRRAQCSFDGTAVKSAFALLLEKVTKPRFAEKGGNID
jgi:hypothetical protein